MKPISELNFPEDVRYTEEHEWVKENGDVMRVGITDYAQDQLGDIVFVELPEVGSSFSKGDGFGTVESVKAVSELYMPLSGEVTAINETLEDHPELVNAEPYEGGWMIEIKAGDQAEIKALKSKDDYLGTLEG